jgi:hypothetical protein
MFSLYSPGGAEKENLPDAFDVALSPFKVTIAPEIGLLPSASARKILPCSDPKELFFPTEMSMGME